MRVGPLRFLATVKELEKVQDEVGGVRENWQDVGKAWVDVQYITGSEKYIAHEKYTDATHKVFMRYFAGITPEMRIDIKGKIYEIVAVQDSHLRDTRHILVVKDVKNG